MTLTSYPSDLTDAAWEVLRPALLALTPRYRGRAVSLRRVCDALAYRLRTGVQWRYLPHDFPTWGNVYRYYRRWTAAGVIHDVNDLIVRASREADPTCAAADPSACVIDAQAVKSGVRGRREARGFAGDKRVNGVKRHVACDTGGRVLACVVSAANRHDGPYAREALAHVRAGGYARVRVAFADAGYRGQERACAREAVELRVVTRGEVAAEVRRRKRLTDEAFVPLPKRWVIERTFGILSQWRALRVSYERRSDHAESAYLLANTFVLLNRF